MKRFRWQILIAVLGVALILLLILGVRGGTARIAPAGPETVRGGKYTEALVGALQRLNPIFAYRNPPDRDVDRLVFSGLIRFDSAGVPLPDLAGGWVIGEDKLTYTLAIRPNAVWHDGKPVTAADAVYTYGLLQDKAYPGASDLATLWRSIKVEALQERVVRFTLPEPYAPFLDYLTVGLLPAHILSGAGVTDLDSLTFNLEPVGSGPFRVRTVLLDEANNITGVSLVPFEHYYGEKPILEQIDFLYYPTQDAAFAALEEGEVMGLGGLTPEETDVALQSERWNLYSARLPESALILLNLHNDDVKFLAEREIRRALLQAIDRQRIIGRLFDGQAIPAAGPILPGTWAADPALEPLAYDPIEAARALDAAGWVIPAGAEPGSDAYVRVKDKQPLAFTLVYLEDPAQQAVAEAIRDDWARAGVRADLRAANMKSLLSDNLEPRTYQAALVNFNLSPYPDPDPYPFWHETQYPNGQNYAQLNDRAISELLETARTETNLAARTRLYQTFQYRFVYQTPALYLWLPVYTYAVDAKVTGVQFGPLFDAGYRLASVPAWYILETK
jgi:peptide/nickel transport system substrate-binding protein